MRHLIFSIAILAACGSSPGSGADGSLGDAMPSDGAPPALDASPDGPPAGTTDDFERTSLGPNWEVVYPVPPNDQVRIVGDSDLGMGPGQFGFFLVDRIAPVFGADQFGEATIPTDVTAGWAHQVYVRRRASDGARYGFGYDNDPGQPNFGDWYFKYDGVPGPQTRMFVTAPATVTPVPGDTIRVEIRGYTLRGYLNGALVLEGTDTDASRIADGVPGLAARWAIGAMPTTSTAIVWESWAGGSL
jgi:hypothetical protein